jgi:hypothetical protein
VQGSFEHFHVVLPIANGSNAAPTACMQKEELFKGIVDVAPPSKLDSCRLQLCQVPLCAISSSYCSYCWVLAVIVVYGEIEDDATTLV